jgi:hypothetical protein
LTFLGLWYIEAIQRSHLTSNMKEADLNDERPVAIGTIGSTAEINGVVDIINKIFQMSHTDDNGRIHHDIYYQGRSGILGTIDNVVFMERHNTDK